MAEEFDHLACPNCGSELVYSDGTHDLGCKNNPKPFEESNKKRERKLHEQPASYGSENEKNNSKGYSAEGSDKEEGANKSNSSKLCDTKKHNKVLSVCELSRDVESSKSCHTDGEQLGLCVFGVSFTESANKETL